MALVNEITVPLPPPMEATATGAETENSAYRILVPPTVADPVIIRSPDGYEFRARPAELAFRDREGQRDYVTGSAPVSLSTDGFGARYARLFSWNGETRWADDVYLLQAEGAKNITLVSEIPRDPAEYLDPTADPETGIGIEFGVTWQIGGITLPAGVHTDLEIAGFRFPRPVARALMGPDCHGRYEILDGDTGQTMIAWFPLEWFRAHPGPYHIDPTVSTSNSAAATGLSGQRRVTRFAGGNALATYASNGEWLRYSSDQGATWQTLAAGGSIPTVDDRASLHTDPDGYIHAIARYPSGPWFRLHRGVPDANQTGISSWTEAPDTFDADFSADIISHQHGTGWLVHVVGSNAAGDVRYRSATIASDGTIAWTTAGETHLGNWASFGCYVAIMRDGSGNGFAIAGNASGIRCWKGTLSGNAYAWGTAETVDAGSSVLAATIDSQGRVVVAYRRASDGVLVVKRRSTSGTWSEVTGIPSITNPTSLAIACNGDDIHVFYTLSGLKQVKWSASDATWGSITTLDAETTANYVSVERSPVSSRLICIYTTGSASPYNVLSHTLSLNSAPYAATVTVASSVFAAATGTDITVTHNDPDGDAMGAWALKRVVDGTTDYWNNTTKAFQADEIYNAGSGTSVTIPAADNAGDWTTGKIYSLYASTRDSLGQTGPYGSEAVQVNVGAKPVVTVTGPAATVNSGEAVVEWTVDVPTSAYQVRLLDAGGAQVSTTGKVASTSARKHTLTGLADGANYTAEVTAWDQTGSTGVASDPATRAFAVDVTEPYALRNLIATADAALAAVKLRWSRDSVYTAVLTRNSVAYLRNGTQVASGAPRYDTVGGASGITVEEATTNLVPYSDPTDLANLAVHSGVSIAAAGAVGSAFAGGLVYGDNSVTRYGYQQPSLSVSTTYTLSALVRMDDGNAPVPGTSSTTGDFALLVAGTIIGSAATVEDVGGGLHRVRATVTTPSSISSNNVGVAKYTGQSARTFKVSGYQLEQKSYLTGYVKTTGASATRAAETHTVPTTGLSPTQGAWRQWVYVDAVARRQVAGQYNRVFQLSRPTGNGNGVLLYHHPSAAIWALETYDDAGAASSTSTSDSNTPDGWHLFEVRWSASELKLLIDGVVRGTIANPKLPSAFTATASVGYYSSSHYLNTEFGQTELRTDYPTDQQSADAYALGVNGLTRDANTIALYSWASNLEGGTQPNVFSGQYEVYRGGTRIALVSPPASGDVEYTDYAVGSGVSYSYQVRATGSNGTYGAYSNVSGSVSFTGLFLHDVADPAGTLLRLTHNRNQAEDWQGETVMQHFAGRTLPVAEIGDAEDPGFKADVIILKNSSQWSSLRQLVRRRGTVCARDSDGRIVYGVIPKLPEQDLDWGGKQVTVEVLETDYSIAV